MAPFTNWTLNSTWFFRYVPQLIVCNHKFLNMETFLETWIHIFWITHHFLPYESEKMMSLYKYNFDVLLTNLIPQQCLEFVLSNSYQFMLLRWMYLKILKFLNCLPLFPTFNKFTNQILQKPSCQISLYRMYNTVTDSWKIRSSLLRSKNV